MTLWIDRYCRLLEAMIALLLAVMVVLVFGNVVLRYGFNSGITMSKELSRWVAARRQNGWARKCCAARCHCPIESDS